MVQTAAPAVAEIILKPHQARDVALTLKALSNFGAALNASDTGTGKTFTFLAMCKQLGARPAVITRLAIKPQWEEACRRIGVDPLFIANYEQCRSKDFQFGHVEKYGSEEKPRSRYHWNPDLGRVIFGFDEAQACRSSSSVQSKLLIEASKRYKTVALSATPFTSPLEAYPIGLALKLFNTSNYMSWLFRHGCKKNSMGFMEFVGERKDRARGLEIMEEIHSTIFPERGCRTRRSEIPGFPDTTVDVRCVETGAAGEIEAVYLDMIAESERMDVERAREKMPEEIAHLAEPMSITRNLRARQKAEALKCRAMAEMAEDFVAKGESVALFVNFDHSIEILRKLLKTDCVVRGARKQNENNGTPTMWIKSFRENNQPYILINNAAGGAGLELHDAVTLKPRTSLISPPYSAVQLKQILGRPHRLNGGYSTQLLCFAAGTVEERRVMPRVQMKLNCLDTLLDGDLDVVC